MDGMGFFFLHPGISEDYYYIVNYPVKNMVLQS